jgi:uncharacterized protein
VSAPGPALLGWRGRKQDVPAGALGLLVLQPTPFCNLSCDYCYLPERDIRARMTMETLEATMRRVFESGLASTQLSIVWHAGEPLAVPPQYYEEAFAVVERCRPLGVRVQHHVQTNGTLLNDRWCELISRHAVRVGVSLDGPAWLHDRHRPTRAGRGTHTRVMAALDRLRRHGIGFHVICVLTRDSLDYPDEIFDFFRDAGVDQLGFNIEEVEAANRSSSLADPQIERTFARFWDRLIDRIRTAELPIHVREIDDVVRALRDPHFGFGSGNAQNTPFRILTVGHQGDFTTYSPELLGIVDAGYGSLAFGNVRSTGLRDALDEGRWRRVSKDIRAGIARCRRSCKYFAFCLGGAPANKLAEHGTFACTETMFCRLTQKIVVECVLRAIEEDRLPVTACTGPMPASVR